MVTAKVAGGNFDAATSLNMTKLESKARVSGGSTTWNLQRVGYVSHIDIPLPVVISGTVGTVNALGGAAIVKRVRVSVNNIGDIVNISGAGYHYLLRKYMGDYRDPVAHSNACSAITATTMNVSMRIPIAFNTRDPLGLLLLQNDQTLLTLTIEWETDANITSTGTIAALNVQPAVYWFTVPANESDRPPIDHIHQIIEDQVAISGAGDFPYDTPRGAIITHMLFGCGINAAGADSWSAAVLKLQQSYTKYEYTPALVDMEFSATHGFLYTNSTALPYSQRPLGLIPFDFTGSSGLGVFGKMRDVIDSRQVTSFRTVITATGAVTLYALRRQIAKLEGA
jgi:hypothetical protein